MDAVYGDGDDDLNDCVWPPHPQAPYSNDVYQLAAFPSSSQQPRPSSDGEAPPPRKQPSVPLRHQLTFEEWRKGARPLPKEPHFSRRDGAQPRPKAATPTPVSISGRLGRRQLGTGPRPAWNDRFVAVPEDGVLPRRRERRKEALPAAAAQTTQHTGSRSQPTDTSPPPSGVDPFRPQRFSLRASSPPFRRSTSPVPTRQPGRRDGATSPLRQSLNDDDRPRHQNHSHSHSHSHSHHYDHGRVDDGEKENHQDLFRLIGNCGPSVPRGGAWRHEEVVEVSPSGMTCTRATSPIDARVVRLVLGEATDVGDLEGISAAPRGGGDGSGSGSGAGQWQRERERALPSVELMMQSMARVMEAVSGIVAAPHAAQGPGPDRRPTTPWSARAGPGYNRHNGYEGYHTSARKTSVAGTPGRGRAHGLLMRELDAVKKGLGEGAERTPGRGGAVKTTTAAAAGERGESGGEVPRTASKSEVMDLILNKVQALQRSEGEASAALSRPPSAVKVPLYNPHLTPI